MSDQWSLLKKFGFLFLTSYIFLYTNSIQFIGSFIIQPIWEKLVPSFAKIVGASKEIKYVQSGSGDTSFDFYLILLFAVISFVFALVLTIIDHKRANYNTLYKWVLILIRYYIAAQMISYGLAKLFYLQFSAPGMTRLDQSYGESSPMGLLWTFMGHSQPYTMFTGFMELIGGLFLLSRKTMILGALTTFGVMLNVMMLNYCYDVPVKLLSTHIVLLSLVLIAYDLKRITQFFFTGESLTKFNLSDVVPENWIKIKSIIKWILLVGYLGYSLYGSYNMLYEYGSKAPKKAFEGAFTVDSFEHQKLPTADTSSVKSNWKTVYNTKWGWTKIKLEDNTDMWRKCTFDTLDHTLNFTSRDDTIGFTLEYDLHQIDGDKLLYVNGVFENDSIKMRWREKNSEDYLLTSRGFRWIQENPYNR